MKTDIWTPPQFWYEKLDGRRKHHIVSIIQDGDTGIVVSKYYGIYKQWWHYEIMEIDNMQSYFECGLYSRKMVANG